MLLPPPCKTKTFRTEPLRCSCTRNCLLANIKKAGVSPAWVAVEYGDNGASRSVAWIVTCLLAQVLPAAWRLVRSSGCSSFVIGTALLSLPFRKESKLMGVSPSQAVVCTSSHAVTLEGSPGYQEMRFNRTMMVIV